MPLPPLPDVPTFPEASAPPVSDLVKELKRRVSQLDDAAALAAINRALAWVSRQGSFTFELTTTGPLSTGQIHDDPQLATVEGGANAVALPDDVDLGKAMFVANSPSGFVIHKAGVQDLWQYAFRNIPAGLGYDTYLIQGRNLMLRPGSPTTLQIGIWYHKAYADLTLTDVPRIPSAFIPMIIDLAESEEKRIYDVGSEWQTILARCQDQIKVMLDGYRSVSQEEMTLADAQQAAAEKSSLGRP